MTPRFDEDPLSPVFYLSYARSRPAAGATRRARPNHVLNLFDDLSEHVAELVGVRPGENPGFVDSSLQGGERWDSAILHAVGHCQVLVALLSPAFLQSEWCAMEWDAFSRRTTVRRDGAEAGHVTSIVPVLWTPESRDLPPRVSSVSPFAPSGLPTEYATQYRVNGLLGLLQTHQTDVYDAIVWKLAMFVRQQSAAYWVQPKVLTNTDGLTRSFGSDE